MCIQLHRPVHFQYQLIRHRYDLLQTRTIHRLSSTVVSWFVARFSSMSTSSAASNILIYECLDTSSIYDRMKLIFIFSNKSLLVKLRRLCGQTVAVNRYNLNLAS